MERPSKADRKAKLANWKEAQRETARKAFPLPDKVLSLFFELLDQHVGQVGCKHSTALAQETAKTIGLEPSETSGLLEWCEQHGGFCDCEIVLNTAGHWEENRRADS